MPPTNLGHGVSATLPRGPSQQSKDGYIRISSDGSDTTRSGQGRRGIPIASTDAKTLMSPIMDTLPSLPNLASLRTFLPNSPPPPSSKSQPPRLSQPPFSNWQIADLRDGYGRQNLLLVSSPECALRIFRMPFGKVPEDSHVEEDFPAPEEVFSLAKLERDGDTRMSQLGGVKQGKREGKEVTVAVHLMDRGSLAEEYGPVALFLTSRPSGKSTQADLVLLVVALRTGLAVREVDLGKGKGVSLECSPRALAIAISDPPRIHLLDPSTLQSFHSHTNLPAGPTPIMALSGRLLAFVTDEPPRSIGSAGFGTLITARSTPRSRVVSEGSDPTTSLGTATSAIMSSAVSIGGGVARGVWAGLKMGAHAAQHANAARLAKSAPAKASALEVEDETLSESRSTESFPVEGIGGAGWIKIVDLGKLPPVEVSSPYASPTRSPPAQPRTVAHFRLPLSKSDHRPQSAKSSQSVAYLSWNPDGTQIFAAPTDGRVFHIFQIHPHGLGRAGGEMLHLYELKRGNTAARVQEVVWDQMGRWVGVVTERGTIHIYPLHPSGAPATFATHSTAKIINPSQFHPLSQVIEAAARLRHLPTDANAPDHAVNVSFAQWQQYPLGGAFCQDVCVFRRSLGVIELQRLSVKQMTVPARKKSGVGKGGSGISEMMRLQGSGDLAVEQDVKSRWKLPDLEEDFVIGSASHQQMKLLAPLANAEIRTYSVNPRILPSSIYLSHQVDFFSARPVDDYSPHSIIDPDARLHRITYRKEVQVKSSTASFDEPLSTALHTRIESPTRGEIPGLPNGPPSSKWMSPIPVRTVAAGVGEGLDRVRQTYVKAQAIRRYRRASEHEANRLSFEEGAIFASSPNGLGLDMDDSSPASESMPISDSAVDDEWAEEWEDEDGHAAEIEEEPDDLVLGLMDEEEEERRKAAVKGIVEIKTFRTEKKGW